MKAPTRSTHKRRLLLPFFLLLQLILSTSVLSAFGGDRLQRISDAVFRDEATGKMWQLERSKRMRSPDEAIDYIAALNSGEYQDWRFPTKQELFELFQVFDLKNNGEVKPQLEGKYWLRNDDGAILVGSWEIGDGCGPSRAFFAARAGYVRAVRP